MFFPKASYRYLLSDKLPSDKPYTVQRRRLEFLNLLELCVSARLHTLPCVEVPENKTHLLRANTLRMPASCFQAQPYRARNHDTQIDPGPKSSAQRLLEGESCSVVFCELLQHSLSALTLPVLVA